MDSLSSLHVQLCYAFYSFNSFSNRVYPSVKDFPEFDKLIITF